MDVKHYKGEIQNLVALLEKVKISLEALAPPEAEPEQHRLPHPEMKQLVEGPLGCPHCEGTGKMARTSDNPRLSWNFWVRLANRLNEAIDSEALCPEDCEHCRGDGHLHSPTLDGLMEERKATEPKEEFDGHPDDSPDHYFKATEKQDRAHCPFCESVQDLIEDAGRWICAKCRGVIFGGAKPGQEHTDGPQG